MKKGIIFSTVIAVVIFGAIFFLNSFVPEKQSAKIIKVVEKENKKVTKSNSDIQQDKSSITKTIGLAGGNLEITSKNGSRVELNIPEEAFQENHNIILADFNEYPYQPYTIGAFFVNFRNNIQDKLKKYIKVKVFPKDELNKEYSQKIKAYNLEITPDGFKTWSTDVMYHVDKNGYIELKELGEGIYNVEYPKNAEL